jgi:hypothetical protein
VVQIVFLNICHFTGLWWLQNAIDTNSFKPPLHKYVKFCHSNTIVTNPQ